MKLTINELTKEYIKGVRALDGITMELTEGVYGLLGPNGAGKSTMMNILTDNLKATSGQVLYNDEPMDKLGKNYRKELGYMPQQQGLYAGFTLNRFLYYMASLKGIKKNDAKKQIPELISLVNLSDVANKKLSSFSGGMKQRALIAQALLGNPHIIILDEPTAGLDPKERVRIRNLVSEISLNRIVIVATHVVSDIESIAKDVIMMKKGKLINMLPPEEFCDELVGEVYEFEVEPGALQDIYKKYIVTGVTNNQGMVRVRVVVNKEKSLQDWVSVTPTLEDVYLKFFGDDWEL